MALVTLIDPKVREDWARKSSKSENWSNFFVGKVTLTEQESDGIFFGLCIVVGL